MKRKDLILWTAIIGLAGSINIYSLFADLQWLEYIFKPGTMIVIIFFGWIGHKKNPSVSSKLILMGLIFGLFGDITLMLKDQLPFVLGLGFFLICHLFYITAFLKRSNSFGTIKQILPYFVFYVAALMFFVPKVGDLAIPVGVYISVIVLMGWRALVVHSGSKISTSMSLVIGSILFMISDTTLAYNKFVEPIWISGFWIMSTYFAAQYFIAKSLHSVD